MSSILHALGFSHGSGLNTYDVLCCHPSVDVWIFVYYALVNVFRLLLNFVSSVSVFLFLVDLVPFVVQCQLSLVANVQLSYFYLRKFLSFDWFLLKTCEHMVVAILLYCS